MKSVMIICLVLAFIAAAVYFLMASHVLTVPTSARAPKGVEGIVYVAGACYALGGLLILLRKRWLWIFGLVMNTLAIAIFFMMYNQNPEIMFSLPGLGTKIAQILLEVGLVYLVATSQEKNPISPPGRLKA